MQQEKLYTDDWQFDHCFQTITVLHVINLKHELYRSDYFIRFFCKCLITYSHVSNTIKHCNLCLQKRFVQCMRKIAQKRFKISPDECMAPGFPL